MGKKKIKSLIIKQNSEAFKQCKINATEQGFTRPST